MNRCSSVLLKLNWPGRSQLKSQMRKLCITVSSMLFLALLGLQPARAQQTSSAAFWGTLAAGPYDVGFKTVYQFDRSRTWRATRRLEMPFAPDLNGRPIRISVWYPAVRDAHSRQMRYADYVHSPDQREAPGEFAELNHILELREIASSHSRVPDGRWPDLQRP